MRLFPFVVLVALATAIPLSAQERVYTEVSRGTVSIFTPQGTAEILSEHDARIVLQEITPDSIEAWYEALSIASITPEGELRPATDAILGERYVLGYDAGSLQTLSTPEFPSSFEGITDLSYQFTDFFLGSQPEGLKIGLSWSDTIAIQSESDGTTSSMHSVAKYIVVEASVYEGVDVFKISSDVEIEMLTDGPVEGQPGLTVAVEMVGPETNEFLVRRTDGVMLLRTRSAMLEGSMLYEGGPQPFVLDISREYTNEIRLITER